MTRAASMLWRLIDWATPRNGSKTPAHELCAQTAKPPILREVPCHQAG